MRIPAPALLVNAPMMKNRENSPITISEITYRTLMIRVVISELNEMSNSEAKKPFCMV